MKKKRIFSIINVFTIVLIISLSSCSIHVIGNEKLSIISGDIINSDSIEETYTPIPEDGHMLVITNDLFYDNMLEFVEWKNMKGIPTIMINRSEIPGALGENANISIRNYITDYYNELNAEGESLSFVLLVGDEPLIPTFKVRSPLGSEQGTFASDVSYSFIVGDDFDPDIYVGRFPVRNQAQIETMVKRSIDYEKNPEHFYGPDAEENDWYRRGIGIACHSGGGFDHRNWMDNIADNLLDFTYLDYNRIYSIGPKGSETEPFPFILSNAINEGRSIITTFCHGGTICWDLDGEYPLWFDIDDVNNLENPNRLPIILSMACHTGNFTYPECFAEAWLHATNDSGEPTGAVGFFGSSSAQTWRVPTIAINESIDVLTGSSFHRKYTFGGICYSGLLAMNHGPWPSLGINHSKTWNVLGDPSLQIRTNATRVGMMADHRGMIYPGENQYEISITDISDDRNPIKGALCALSINGQLIGKAYTNKDGYASIDLDETVLNQNGLVSEKFDLVVTAFNRFPIIDVVSTPGQPISENGHMLIITNESFYRQMVPFVNWKKQKGIPTEIVTLSDIKNIYGDSTNVSIKQYIANYCSYLNNIDENLAFVLLVGDYEQMPTFIIDPDIPSHQPSACDMIYSFLELDNSFPSIIIGRFPARTIEDIETMVDRSIAYEKYPDLNGIWYSKGVCAAGSPTPGWNFPQHMDEIWEKLVSYPNAYSEEDLDRLYAIEGGGYTGPEDLINAINSGRGIINYFGHGNIDHWEFSTVPGEDDNFTIEHINQLENTNMLPWIWQQACLTGNFVQDICFAEAWLKATDDNGEPTGAIAVCMPSSITSSTPISLTEMNNILTEQSYHTKTTFGGITYNGLANIIYYNNDLDDSILYNIFGDPSLQIRTETPKRINVCYRDIITSNLPTISIKIYDLNGQPVENALCAISSQNALSEEPDNVELLGYGYTDERGKVDIVFNKERSYGRGLELVVTGFNLETHIEKIVYPSLKPDIGMIRIHR